MPFTANMYPMLCVEYPEITSHDKKNLHYLKIFLLIRIRCDTYVLNYTHFYRIIVKYHSNIGRSKNILEGQAVTLPIENSDL